MEALWRTFQIAEATLEAFKNLGSPAFEFVGQFYKLIEMDSLLWKIPCFGF